MPTVKDRSRDHEERGTDIGMVPGRLSWGGAAACTGTAIE